MSGENSDIKRKSFGIEHLDFEITRAEIDDIIDYCRNKTDETPNVIDDVLKKDTDNIRCKGFDNLPPESLALFTEEEVESLRAEARDILQEFYPDIYTDLMTDTEGLS